MDTITFPITKLSIPQTPDSSVTSAKDLEWMHYTSTPSQPFRVSFRSSSSSRIGRLERVKVRLEVMGGDAVYASLELSEYARSWNQMQGQPLGYKMKDKCVLIKYTSPLQAHRQSATGHRFQLRFSTLADTQSFVAALIQHCPRLALSDRPPNVFGGGEVEKATIHTPSASGGGAYGMGFGSGSGTGMGGKWGNETELTTPIQPSYDADGFRIPKRPIIQPLRLPPREYDPNLSSARQRYAPPSPSFDRDLSERSQRGLSVEGRVGIGAGGTTRNEINDFSLSQEPFAEDTQMQSQTQPTGYTQQMMPLPIPYHPSPLKFGGEASMRREGWSGGTQTQSQRMSPDVFGGGTSRYGSPLRNQHESSMRGLGIQPRKFARVDSDLEVRYSPAPGLEKDQLPNNSQRMETLPSMRVAQPEACPSGRPTLVSMPMDQPGVMETQEPGSTKGMKMMAAVGVQKDVIITSVRAASQLYELPEEEIAELMAEVLREDGFEGFVGKISKMSWRALALIGAGRQEDTT